MAAGNSRRFDGNKLLCELNGRKIITYALDIMRACKQSGILSEAAVVTQYDEVERLAAEYGYSCLYNEFPDKGISYSVKLGTEYYKDADAVLFFVCDQPFLTKETVESMIEEADEKHILCCSFGDRKGSPTLFPKCYFDELMELTGDEGGRVLIRKYPALVKKIEVRTENELTDIDTMEEYQSVQL